MVNDIKLIFTSTTGRSGTRYLANIINKNAKNATAEHDPYPRGYGEPILWYDNKETQKLQRLCKKKITRLERGRRKRNLYFPKISMLRSYFPTVEIKDIYLESTHAYIKSFAEEMSTFNLDINIIHLTRDPLEVAKSFFNRKSIPGSNNPYLLNPDFKRNQLKISFHMNDFQKCLWYWFENELRHQQFIEKHPEIQSYEIDIKQLNDKKSLENMFNFFKITYHDFTFDLDRNKNVKPTILTKEDLMHAKQLVDQIPDDVFKKINNTYQIQNQLSKITT